MGERKNGDLHAEGRTPEQSGKAIKACAYLRVATADQTEQDISLSTQRERVLGLAERHGYEIIKTYEDKGRSGADPNRSGWRKLLSDAATAEWEVILCLNRSRFSRLEHIENSLAIHTLRDAGKKIHTAIEGLLEWHTTAGRIIDQMIAEEEGTDKPIVVENANELPTTAEQPVDSITSMGRIMDTIRDEMAQTHSANLARKSLEGKLIIFRNGECVAGRCPYGYAFRVTDPQGNAHQISRKENFVVPKTWTKILVPGDPKEVEVVQWLFAEYATKDVSFRWLAKELNAKGVPAPQGEAWPASAIVRLLANDAYVGDTRFGRRSSGKFAHLKGDKVVKANRNAPVKQQDGLVQQNTHEGIISRDLWDQVQAKLNKGRTAGPLLGMLVCGHCNQHMYATRQKGENGAESVRYVCHNGMCGTGTCSVWSVREDDILPVVIDKLASEHGVSVTAETCREILQRHRCRVTCWWKPDSRPRVWVIDRVMVEFDMPEST